MCEKWQKAMNHIFITKEAETDNSRFAKAEGRASMTVKF